MPYKIVKSGNKYKVMKKSGSKHVFGTHPSEKAALNQIRAIRANESVEQKLTFEQYVTQVLSSL